MKFNPKVCEWLQFFKSLYIVFGKKHIWMFFELIYTLHWHHQLYKGIPCPYLSNSKEPLSQFKMAACIF